MGNQMRYLSKPVTDCYFETGTGKSYSYTAASMQGWRKFQEDRFVCIPNFYEDSSFFGVYDGHGGSEIAEFLAQRLHFEVIHSLQTQDDIELALQLGFLSCDASIMEPENIALLNDMVEEESRGIALKILKNQRSIEAAISEAGDYQSSAGPSAQPTVTDRIPSATASKAGDEQSSAGPSAEPIVTDRIPALDADTSGIIQRIMQVAPNPSIENIIAAIQQNQQDPEESMEIERPLDYLLSDDIEPSDPEDEDYNIEDDEESSSTESEEEANCISTKELLASEPGSLSGSTATVAIIQQNRIYVANVGDSRCVLSRNGQAIDMSLDHKPDDPDERARIIGAGGTVSSDGRVNNCLNLSRAFGDFKFKGDSFIPSQQCITAEPFIKSIDIEKDDDFLIIASDGIWNSMSSQEVVDYINIRLQAGDSELKDICEEMFKFTLAPNKDNDGTGCDNMCCIIIRFDKKGDSFVYKACSSNEVRSSDDSLKQEEKNINAPTSSSADQTTSNILEKTSNIDEINDLLFNQDSHLAIQCLKQPIQHLLDLHWFFFSLQKEKNIKNLILKSWSLINEVKKRSADHEASTHKISSDILQKGMPSAMCCLKQKETSNMKSNIETEEFYASVSSVLEDISSYKKYQYLEKPCKLDHLGGIDFADNYVGKTMYHFKNTQFKELFLGFQKKGIENLPGGYCKFCTPFSSVKQDLCNKYSNIFTNSGHVITVSC